MPEQPEIIDRHRPDAIREVQGHAAPLWRRTHL